MSDKGWMTRYFRESGFMGCEYTFGNCFIWSPSYVARVLEYNGFCVVKWGTGDDAMYSFPAGNGDLRDVITAIIKDSVCYKKPFALTGITDEAKKRLDSAFPDMFDYIQRRDKSDYIYLSEKLISLSGKKLQAKRNHIARFKDNKNWGYEPITRENIDECLEMSRKWRNEYGERENMDAEFNAVEMAIENFFELDFDGGLLRLNGEVAAYSIGEPLDKNTYVIHIEKAYRDIQGAYPMINQQFALRNCQNYTYVNREEDMGAEGLRRAKMSYHPEILLDKAHAVIKERFLSDFKRQCVNCGRA
ncbi:MAG: phosphatidylglycerol lysyltransferase domain-containing protein [Clostridiales bacterium]|jgi:hypothetical protein|nr:phosphatidylglycerol lysyltransferase domain-containing protein [Clostridiales bacterium]